MLLNEWDARVPCLCAFFLLLSWCLAGVYVGVLPLLVCYAYIHTYI